MDNIAADVAPTLVGGAATPMAKGSIGGQEEQIFVVCAWKISCHTKHLKTFSLIIFYIWKHFTTK